MRSCFPFILHDSTLMSESYSIEPFQFWNLPQELLIELLQNLNVRDIISLQCCCSFLHKFCKEELLWKHIFNREFGVGPDAPLESLPEVIQQEIRYLQGFPELFSWKELVKGTPKWNSECLHPEIEFHNNYLTAAKKITQFTTWSSSRTQSSLSWNSCYQSLC